MRKLKTSLILVFFLVISSLLAACAKEADEEQKAESQPKTAIIVSAAASLKDVMNDIKVLYAAENPQVVLTYNFGSSGSLQQQIENGAEADLFISAGQKQMDALSEKGLMGEDTRVDLLGNKLVLVVPEGSDSVKEFNDLTKDDVKKIAIGEPSSVPAGAYAKETLENLNLYSGLSEKLVLAKDVKEVISWVETGNADAGLVYETDAKVSGKLVIAATADESTHKPIIYPAAVIGASKNKEESEKFLEFLKGKEAQAVFEKYGFVFMPQ